MIANHSDSYNIRYKSPNDLECYVNPVKSEGYCYIKQQLYVIFSKKCISLFLETLYFQKKKL